MKRKEKEEAKQKDDGGYMAGEIGGNEVCRDWAKGGLVVCTKIAGVEKGDRNEQGELNVLTADFAPWRAGQADLICHATALIR